MCIDPLRGYIKLLWELHVGMLHMYVNVWLAGWLSLFVVQEAPNVMPLDQEV